MTPYRVDQVPVETPAPVLIRGRWRRVFVMLWGLGPILGVLRAFRVVYAHGYRDRELPGLMSWIWREALIGGMRNAFLGAAVIATFMRFAQRIEPDERRRRRALTITPLAAIGLIVGLLWGGAWWFRPYLGGALAEDVGLWVIVSNIVLPTLADDSRVPRFVLAILMWLALALSFLCSRLVFRRRIGDVSRESTQISRALRWSARLGLASVCAGVVAIVAMATTADRTRPDIVLISIDTLRADHLKPYGYQRDTSPTLSNLAESGILVEKLISHAPWTLPTHMSIFTGRRPYEHGVTSIESVLGEGVTTLGEWLKDVGYSTGAIVTNYLLSPSFGFARGFDSYRLRPDFHASVVVDLAIDWWSKTRSPRFLFIHLYDPHYPYTPPDDVEGRFGPLVDRVDEMQGLAFMDFAREAPGFTPSERQAVIDRYDEEIFAADAAVARLLEHVDSGSETKPWVIVTSDHGEEFNDHGLWGHSVTLYEEMIRVPLIIRPPGGDCVGVRETGLIEQRRLFDLIAGISHDDIASPGNRCVEGRSPEILQRLTSPNAISESEVFGPHRFAVRTAEKKRIEPICFDVDAFAVDRTIELYDLLADPRENTNLYPEWDDDKLRAILMSENESRSRLVETEVGTRDISDVERERLRSLGYLQ